MLMHTALLVLQVFSLVTAAYIPISIAGSTQQPLMQVPGPEEIGDGSCTLGFDETCDEGYICASFGPGDEPHCVEQRLRSW